VFVEQLSGFEDERLRVPSSVACESSLGDQLAVAIEAQGCGMS
jgi:hypothetical protein